MSKGELSPLISYVQLASGSIHDGQILFAVLTRESMADNMYFSCLFSVLDCYFSGKSAHQ